MTRILDPSNILGGDSTTDHPDVAVAGTLDDLRQRWFVAPKVLAAIPKSPATLIDVATELQRLGTLDEIAETDDGVIVGAASRRDRKGEVVVWTGYAIGDWHPSDIYTQGLGGSETAAWRLSEELAGMGYRVSLYGQFAEEGVFGDVILRDFRAYDPSQPLHAFVSFRNARVFEDFRPNADTTILWLEDLAGAHSEGLTERNAANIDHICTVSYWHKEHMQAAYPWLDKAKVKPLRNGVTLEFFENDQIERQQRVVYSSSPDRGLDILLDLWPRIRAEVPDAELICTYSRWYDIVATVSPQVQENRQAIIAKLDQPGVKRLEGGLGQNALAHLMLSSLVWVHPSWYSIQDMQMLETSCISCMEAQAAGLVVVASNWGALSENVQVGTLIDGDPRVEGSWRDIFVKSVIAGLTDKSVQGAAQTEGPEAMRDMDWFGAADMLRELFAVKP